jgi:signal transduction histidine kinase/CheY-like chemotaxis protein
MTRALVVDDKLENRYLLRALLSGHGFEVAEADNGAEALAAARLQAPDVVVSDLLMPVMDGYTLLREWKADAALSAIPFIVYTATYTEPKDEQLALDLGANAFVVKPAEPEVFIRRVQAVLAQAQAGALPSHAQAPDEAASLKLYSEVLVRKLEKKSAQLEQRIAALAASEEHIRRLNQLYMALSETNQAIVHGTDCESLFREVCRVAVERGGLKMAWVGLLDVRSGEIVPAAASGPCEAWFSRLRPFSINGPRRAPTEYAVGEGRIHICNDLDAAPEHAAIRGLLAEAGLRAAASLPLRQDDHVIGALTLFAGEKDFFDAKLTALVTEMAADVSFALANYEKEDLRRQAEEELKRVNQELETRVAARTADLAAANQELEAFAYSASHDLRAPLRSIDGFSRILLEDYGDRLDEEGRAHLERVCRAAQRMGLLIDDLIELSRVGQQSLQLAEADLSRMAHEVLDEQRQAHPGRRFEMRVMAGCVANGDARLLRVCLQNLLENAVKYSSKAADARVEFGCETLAGEMVFHVRDNGAGFDMRHAERLFQPFQRLHRPDDFEGTGIGLATAARVVVRHGGRIWAESAPGEGATFRFTLAATTAVPPP